MAIFTFLENISNNTCLNDATVSKSMLINTWITAQQYDEGLRAILGTSLVKLDNF